jgi:hypothetical protein
VIAAFSFIRYYWHEVGLKSLNIKKCVLGNGMGFWFFLSVLVAGNMMFKAYKWRITSRNIRGSDERVLALEKELKAMHHKIEELNEAVFFGDFDLKRKFNELEKEIAQEKRHH